MSIVSVFMVLLFVSMHACGDARHSPGFGIFNKDMANEETKITHEIGITSLLTPPNTKEAYLDETSLSRTMFDESRSIAIQMQGLTRRERKMIEAENETKKPSNAKEDEAVEDAVVMDYVTPHRKSPIHNNRH
ncbi:hypothetical protein vseg_020315 [Gypsophila vaccaria]